MTLRLLLARYCQASWFSSPVEHDIGPAFPSAPISSCWLHNPTRGGTSAGARIIPDGALGVDWLALLLTELLMSSPTPAITTAATAATAEIHRGPRSRKRDSFVVGGLSGDSFSTLAIIPPRTNQCSPWTLRPPSPCDQFYKSLPSQRQRLSRLSKRYFFVGRVAVSRACGLLSEGSYSRSVSGVM
jgi:hypothetical protein